MTQTEADPYAHWRSIKVVTVRPNPNAINELIEELKNKGIIDLYKGRMEWAAKRQVQIK
jgi:hypothetical protein